MAEMDGVKAKLDTFKWGILMLLIMMQSGDESWHVLSMYLCIIETEEQVGVHGCISQFVEAEIFSQSHYRGDCVLIMSTRLISSGVQG